MCWVIPPNSPETTFALLSTSSTDVLPWSTWPMTVTIGGRFFKFSVLEAFIFWIISSAFSSLIGLWPNSLTKYSAVSAANVWLIVTVTPIPNKCLITLLDCSAILFASSLTVIASGILTSLLIGFKFSWESSFVAFLISFCLALFTDAKLLCFASISSLSALDTVNFNSLFFVPAFKVFLSLFSLSPLSRLVALCSASFLFSKSFVIGGDLGLNEGFNGVPLLKVEVVLGLFVVDLNDPPLLENFPVCFSITTEFFPWDLAISIFLIDFLAEPEIVNFVFFSIPHHSIFINNVSSRHN